MEAKHLTTREHCTIKPDERISPYLTIDSCVAVRTGALVRPITVQTRASIEARFGVTLVDIILAVAASESR